MAKLHRITIGAATIVLLLSVPALEALKEPPPHKSENVEIPAELLGNAIAKDDDVKPNKFNTRKALDPEAIILGMDASSRLQGDCNNGISLLWSSPVGASVYSTPLLTDLHSDGRKEILLPTFTHYIEALDGQTGDDMTGWPFTHPRLAVQGSPVVTDIDSDGSPEIMVGTFDGDLVFFKENGEVLPEHTIHIPALKVPKMWADFTGDAAEVADANAEREYRDALVERREHMYHAPGEATPAPPKEEEAPAVVRRHEEVHLGNADGQGSQGSRQLLQLQAEAVSDESPGSTPDENAANEIHEDHDEPVPLEQQYPLNYRSYYGLDDEEGMFDYKVPTIPLEKDIAGTDGWLSDEARASMDLVYHPELFKTSVNIPNERDPLTPHQNASATATEKHIFLDPHILSTPVIVDLDFDGNLEVVVTVSYFYDENFYTEAGHDTMLPGDIDPQNYAAGGLVVLDLATGNVKWSKHLDLTTRKVQHQAMIFGSPSIADIDGDRSLDIVVATALGFIVVYDSHGKEKTGWPQVMAAIQGQPLVEDINGDGSIDICAADVLANVACFHKDGRELWERQLSGAIYASLTAGDVNGDGYLDVVVGTHNGDIWALDGRAGGTVDGFPFRTGGAIFSPSLLVNLNASKTDNPDVQRGLHVVVPSHDGFMYVISGRNGCFEMIDIGEKTYSMVLADDITGTGSMDLLVTTMNGNVLLFETETPFHPLKVWEAQTHALSSMTAREGHVGIFITPETRHTRDVVGDFFKIRFVIYDERPKRHQATSPIYYVAITIGRRVLVLARPYTAAKAYTEYISTPLERVYATVYVTMRTDSGQVYMDSVAMGFNLHYLDSIKWVLVIPFVVTMIALMFVRGEHTLEPDPNLRYPYDDHDDLHA